MDFTASAIARLGSAYYGLCEKDADNTPGTAA